MNWRIYYDDGSTFDDTQGSPADAPGYGVLVILIADPDVGHMTLHSFDYYVFREGLWLGVDTFGLIDQILNNFTLLGGVVAGRTVSPQHFRVLLKWAERDPDFAPKSAYRPTIERKL